MLMIIKDNASGKELSFELLSNGILRAYDYSCGWDVTFKKVNGVWEGQLNGGLCGYRGILDKLNELQAHRDFMNFEINFKTLNELV